MVDLGPLELKGVLVSQRWGMSGTEGKAAKLFVKESGLNLRKEIPIGEFIIGGDNFNKTFVDNKDKYIIDFFKTLSHVELGKTSYCNFGHEVPFNLKIVSVGKPAPLTCHPDEKMAKLYHSKNVKKFPSPETRNQIVIALSSFELLVGFRSLDYILEMFERVPEMKYLIDEKLMKVFLEKKDSSDFLKIFANLLDSLPSQVELSGRILSERLMESAPSSLGSFHPTKLFLKLRSHYPYDVGIFLPYFLNVVKLNPLDSLKLDPGIPYAYLFGEAFECSNPVENATKAAFTTSKDLNEFLESVDLRFMSKEQIKEELFVFPHPVGNNIVEYLTHYPYFRVFRGTLCRGTKMVLPQLKSFSILFFIEGEGIINDENEFFPGSAFLFFAEENISLTVEEKGFFMHVGVNFI